MISMKVEMEKDILRVAAICLLGQDRGHSLVLLTVHRNTSLQNRLLALESVFKGILVEYG